MQLREIDISSFTLIENLGETTGGQNRGNYITNLMKDSNSQNTYVVKSFPQNSNTIQFFSRILRQVDNVYSICHPSFQHIVGYFNGNSKISPSIIYDYYPLRSLKDLINNNTNLSEFNPTLIMKICYGVAYALNLMHLHQPPYFHLEVRPGNVYLNSRYDPCLGGYGCLNTVNKDSDYLAPEISMNQQAPTSAVDVFAYGCLLNYIFKNYISSHNNTKRNFTNSNEINDKVPKYYKSLIKKCTNNSPEKRPPFSEILTFLDSEKLMLTGVDKQNFADYRNRLMMARPGGSTFTSPPSQVQCPPFLLHQPPSQPPTQLSVNLGVPVVMNLEQVRNQQYVNNGSGGYYYVGQPNQLNYSIPPQITGMNNYPGNLMPSKKKMDMMYPAQLAQLHRPSPPFPVDQMMYNGQMQHQQMQHQQMQHQQMQYGQMQYGQMQHQQMQYGQMQYGQMQQQQLLQNPYNNGNNFCYTNNNEVPTYPAVPTSAYSCAPMNSDTNNLPLSSDGVQQPLPQQRQMNSRESGNRLAATGAAVIAASGTSNSGRQSGRKLLGQSLSSANSSKTAIMSSTPPPQPQRNTAGSSSGKRTGSRPLESFVVESQGVVVPNSYSNSYSNDHNNDHNNDVNLNEFNEFNEFDQIAKQNQENLMLSMDEIDHQRINKDFENDTQTPTIPPRLVNSPTNSDQCSTTTSSINNNSINNNSINNNNDNKFSANDGNSGAVGVTVGGGRLLATSFLDAKRKLTSGKTVDDIFEEAFHNEKGDTVYLNIIRATKLFKEAADNGHVESQYILAMKLLKGIGTRVDRRESLRYFKMSFNLNHEERGVGHEGGGGKTSSAARISELIYTKKEKGVCEESVLYLKEGLKNNDLYANFLVVKLFVEDENYRSIFSEQEVGVSARFCLRREFMMFDQIFLDFGQKASDVYIDTLIKDSAKDPSAMFYLGILLHTFSISESKHPSLRSSGLTYTKLLETSFNKNYRGSFEYFIENNLVPSTDHKNALNTNNNTNTSGDTSNKKWLLSSTAGSEGVYLIIEGAKMAKEGREAEALRHWRKASESSCWAPDRESIERVVKAAEMGKVDSKPVLDLLTLYADNGSGAARETLGILLIKGKIVEKNVSRGLMYMKAAFDDGNYKMRNFQFLKDNCPGFYGEK